MIAFGKRDANTRATVVLPTPNAPLSQITQAEFIDDLQAPAARIAIDATSVSDTTPRFDALRGGLASYVVADVRRGQVYKTYRPPWWVYALYWLSFQARFPYSWRPEALQTALERRTVARLLTRYWYGNDRVAPIVGYHRDGDGAVLISTLVPGGPPRDRRAARRWLNALRDRFVEAGLPTWQIASYNPRAISNVIETPDGRYIVIDLESTLVTLAGESAKALRCGAFPIFDDVDFCRLRAFFADHRASLSSALGPSTVNELWESINRLQRSDESWRCAEPRIVARLVGAAVRLFWRRVGDGSSSVAHQG